MDCHGINNFKTENSIDLNEQSPQFRIQKSKMSLQLRHQSLDNIKFTNRQQSYQKYNKSHKTREMQKLNSNISSIKQDQSSMNRSSILRICVIEEDGNHILEEDIEIQESDEESYTILNDGILFDQEFMNQGQLNSSGDNDDMVIFEERSQTHSKGLNNTIGMTSLLSGLKQDEQSGKDISMVLTARDQRTLAFSAKDNKSDSVHPFTVEEELQPQKSECCQIY